MMLPISIRPALSANKPVRASPESISIRTLNLTPWFADAIAAAVSTLSVRIFKSAPRDISAAAGVSFAGTMQTA